MLKRRHVLQALPFSVLALSSMTRAQEVRATLEVTPPDFAVPANATDCHVHVFEPVSRFPPAASRTYTPGLATLADLETHLAKLKCQRVVLVQASPYGTDNSTIVWALQQLGGRGRGVAVIAPDISDAELDRLHAAGVRGVRVNLSTTGITDPAVAAKMVRDAAERIKGRNWHIQIYTELAMVDHLRPTIERALLPVVFDHFARLNAAQDLSQKGYDSLIRLIRTGRAYVKLSAPHRISTAPDYADVAPYAKTLIGLNPDRMLWGSDWPHPASPAGQPEKVFPFRNEDDGAGLNRFARWAETPEMIERILVTNPARLYDWA